VIFTEATTQHQPKIRGGLIFDGHANFVAIINELKTKFGLGTAKNVMLTGASAGAIGTFYNVVWLAEQLPGANVKAAPFLDGSTLRCAAK
jgi:hypothetical protein